MFDYDGLNNLVETSAEFLFLSISFGVYFSYLMKSH